MLWALGVVLLTLQSFCAQPGTQQCEGIHTQISIVNFLVAPSFPELCPAPPSCLSLPQTLFPQFCKAVGLYLNSLSLLFCLPEKYLQAESWGECKAHLFYLPFLWVHSSVTCRPMYEEVPSLTLSSFPVVQSGPYSIMSRSPGELLNSPFPRS